MGSRGLSSFDAVAKRYAETIPIRGARKADDLRPIGQRRYWWARIMKVSDTKYALLDGQWCWYQNTPAEHFEKTCPILWERKEDGDYITIRSHMNDGISVSRYTFLDRWLPSSMRFSWDNGKHYVLYKNQEFYLPKFKGVMDWNNKVFTMKEDHKLVFKHEGGDEFTRVGELLPKKTRRLDKDLNKHYMNKAAELYDWMQIVLPVLGEGFVHNRTEYAENLSGNSYFWNWDKNVEPDVVRRLLDNEDDPLRIAFAVCIGNEIDARDREGRFAPEADSLTRLKRKVQRMAGLYITEMV